MNNIAGKRARTAANVPGDRHRGEDVAGDGDELQAAVGCLVLERSRVEILDLVVHPALKVSRELGLCHLPLPLVPALA